MSTSIFLVLSSMAMAQCSVSAFQQALFQDVEKLKGYNITSSILEYISRYERMSTNACAIQCLALYNCNSFFYNTITDQCQLHSEVFLDNTGASLQPGIVYFYSTTPRCPTDEGFQILGSYPDELCIKFHTDKKNWFEANSTCANYSPSGHLAVVDTALKDTLVRTAGVAMGSIFRHRIYIGITSDGWIDGSPMLYNNWIHGSVSSLGAGECAAYGRQSGWRWNVNECTGLIHYVCQIPI